MALGLMKRKNPISAVRIKKFCATTQFDSATIQATGYKPPFSLEKGLEITIKSIIEDRKASIAPVLSPALQPNG
jgi:hypothetical protein